MRGGKGLLFLGVGVLLCFAAAPDASAQPDVIVGSLPNTNSYGTTGGGIYAYSVATTSCNIGTTNLQWQAGNNQHPVIGQDMWRLLDGRFTQIGTSWLKHGFCALQDSGLCPGCGGAGGCLSFLTPGCADPYSAGLNGTQSNLGPRSQVNATTGFFPFPYSAPPFSGNGRRLLVAESDLLPAQNPGALYFVSGQYVTADDAAAGNQANNASYRRVNVGATGNHTLSNVGATQQQQPAIQAWQDFQPGVTLVDVMVPSEGLFIAGYDVTDNGDGTWRYEYAVYNMYSDRSADSFFIPVPPGATLSDVGFHDINWHSGEPYSTADWTNTQTPGVGITWSTANFATNPNANALRWSMMFNFWFTCDAPPATGNATLHLFKPGAVTELTFAVDAPSGNFLPSVQNLTCVQSSPTGSTVDLAWTNGTAYDSITVRRGGVVVGNLGGGATSFSDNPGFGSHNYTVQGSDAGIPSAEIPCSIDILPAPVTGLSCSQPDPNLQDIELSWTNGMVYDEIHVYLGINLQGVLAGTATSFAAGGLPVALHTYRVAGVVGGVESVRIDCAIDVQAPPPLGFTFRIIDSIGSYDPGTGIGQADVPMAAFESPSNLGFPNAVQGFSIGATFDSSMLAIASVSEGAAIDNPSFFDGELLPTSLTVGVIIDFNNLVTISLASEVELVVANFVTNSGNLAGNGAGATTAVELEDGLGSGVSPVDNIVVVNALSYAPSKVDGTVTLNPASGGGFRRGDANGDTDVNIADGVYTLDYLFASGPATCLDALEANDDGTVNIADGVTILNYLFLMGAAPPAPFPGCGTDPTPDGINCVNYAGTCP